MAMLLDPVLRKAPDATRRWDCPWFRIVAGLCVLVIIVGYLAHTSIGTAVAVMAALLIGREIGQRDDDVPSCDV